MTAVDTRQDCPPWCRLTDHEPFKRRHVSREVKIGNRYRGKGEASAWLEQHTGGPTWLAIAIAHMGVATLELSTDDAADWFKRAAGLLAEAGQG